MKKIIIYLVVSIFIFTACGNKDLQVVNNEINDLNKKISLKDTQIKNFKEQISNYQYSLQKLETEMKKKDNELENLQKKLDQTKEEIKTLQSKLKKTTLLSVSGITHNGLIFGISEKNYNPIIISVRNFETGKLEGGIVVGGSVNNQWVEVDDFVLPNQGSKAYLEEFDIDLVKGRENYKIFADNSYLGSVVGGKPSYSYTPSSGTHTIEIEFIRQLDIRENVAIGIDCNWNVLPRTPEILENNNGYSIDLDNDGIYEIFKVVSENEGSGYRDYIFQKNDIETINFASSFVDIANNIWSKILFADLNGDDKLEIIIISMGHERSIGIYEYKDGLIEEVLEYYEGD